MKNENRCPKCVSENNNGICDDKSCANCLREITKPKRKDGLTDEDLEKQRRLNAELKESVVPHWCEKCDEAGHPSIGCLNINL